MQVKKFLAPDIRQAIEALREELGPDAIILSNRRVEGGIELVASLDYEEGEELSSENDHQQEEVKPTSTIDRNAPANHSSNPQTKLLHTNDNSEQKSVEQKSEIERRLLVSGLRRDLLSIQSLLDSQISDASWHTLKTEHPYRAKLIDRLVESGFDHNIAEEVFSEVSEELEFSQAWRMAMSVLAQKLRVTRDDILTDGGVVMLLGPTGVGKTTSVAKLAAGYAMRHGADKVALVTTDCFRIGALEQLRTYGRILGVPVRAASTADELTEVIKSLYDKKLILIDTAGIGPREKQLLAQFVTLKNAIPQLKSYLVLSAVTHKTTLAETMKSYMKDKIHGCILTKLDETTALGEVLSLFMDKKLPLAYVSDGQRVPEDLHQARSHSLVKRSEEVFEYFKGTNESVTDEKKQNIGLSLY